MTKYGNDSPLAALRLVVMACMVERRMTPTRRRHLLKTTAQFGLGPDDLDRIGADYEKDVLSAQDKGFYFGDGAFPKSVVHAALAEITHLDLRLQVAYQMVLAILAESKHSAKEVFFVEAAIGFWGIKKAWRAMLATMNEDPKSAAVRAIGWNAED